MPSVAEDACEKILIPNVLEKVMSVEQTLALATLVTSEEQYNEVKEGGVAYGPWVGTWSDYTASRAQYLASYDFRLDYAEASRVFSSYLSPDQIQAWANCQNGKLGGVTAALADIQDDAVTMIVTWHHSSDRRIGRTVKLSIDPQGSSDTGDEISAKLYDNKLGPFLNENLSRSVIVSRKPKTNLRLTINSDINTDHFLLPWVNERLPCAVAYYVSLSPNAGTAKLPCAESDRPLVSLNARPNSQVRIDHEGHRRELGQNSWDCWTAGNGRAYRANIRNVAVGPNQKFVVLVSFVELASMRDCDRPPPAVIDAENKAFANPQGA
jgi:hypothetical protein